MLTKLRRLSGREKRLLFKAVTLLPMTLLRVRLNLRMPQGSMTPCESAGGHDPQVIADTVRMVKAAARYVPGATCLPQSIVVYRLLRAEGILTTIRIGVRKSAAALDGHAWVEHEGRPITDLPAVHHEFTVLAADTRS